MRAYSTKQFYEKEIDTDAYQTSKREGTFKAILDYKRWGKKKNILAYFTLDNGSKIMAVAWQNTGYLGIPEIEPGTVVLLTFKRAKKGIAYLRGVEKEK